MKSQTSLSCGPDVYYDESKLKTSIDNREIKIRSCSGFIVIPIEQIIYLEAAVNYTIFYLEDNKIYLSSRTIKYYEELLDKHLFLRVHKAHIININFIQHFDIRQKNEKGHCSAIQLKSGKQVDISRRKLKEVAERFQIVPNLTSYSFLS